MPCLLWLLLLYVLLLACPPPPITAVSSGGFRDSRRCHFPAIFNFGDSNSNTGGISAAMAEILPPNGESFFGKPSGRACDGRLIIDFIAENLGLPYLSAYLDSIDANFVHGANFATGGSSIQQGGFSPFYLGIQISQFIQFKSRTVALYNQKETSSKTVPPLSILPRPSQFSKALYTFDIGQNDLAYGLQHKTEEQVRASIPGILNQLVQAIDRLYKDGARAFWIHNTGPIGCLPYSAIYYPANPNNFDEFGCVKPQNNLVQEFNEELKGKVSQLRKRFPSSAFTYVDLYSAKYALISRGKDQGFKDPMEFCCGSYYGYHIDCGKRGIVNGTVYGNPCNDPSSHISWDGIHYSQAANLWVANLILNGSYSDPPVPISEACHDRNLY